MTVPVSCLSDPRVVRVGRQRDRRLAVGDLLESLTRAVTRPHVVQAMRSDFEQRLERIIGARTVRLCELRAPAGARAETITRGDAISVQIPVGDRGAPFALEAIFEQRSPPSDWDMQLLGLGAHLATLILEIERGQTLVGRVGPAPVAARSERQPAIVGSTPAVHVLRTAIERAARTDFTVLIEGETGVGKELVARQIHEGSRRRGGPFVAINCAALVETLLESELFGIEERIATGVRGRRGKFEQAEGGTLFLDEVSELSPSAQAKLLRAMQDLAVERVGGTGAHRVDIRVVAATNRHLGALVEQRLFRADLFYRLSGVDIRVPPLRERRADVLVLAAHFLDRYRPVRPLRLSASAADALVRHDWPGNVRELERLIERLVAFAISDVIDLDDLPRAIGGSYGEIVVPSLARGDSLREWAGRYARLVFERCEGNKREACRVLGISYHTLQSYLRRSGPLPIDEADGPDVGDGDDGCGEDVVEDGPNTERAVGLTPVDG